MRKNCPKTCQICTAATACSCQVKITGAKYGGYNFHRKTIMKVLSRITQHTETVADGTKVQVTVAEVHGSGGAARQHASG